MKQGEALLLSRYEGYRDCLHGRTSKHDLNKWIFKQTLGAKNNASDGWAAELMGKAIATVIPSLIHLKFDFQLMQTTLVFEGERAVLLDDLSDGQRTMVTLVGDITRRAITLNPHLKQQALKETEGVVLIDELDLHLHPSWQRRVVENLTTIFPKIQFLCTTHSPQIIGEVPPEQELIHELVKIVGEDDPDIIRCRTLMSFLKEPL